MGTASEDARANVTQKLLTYGFRYFETHKLYEKGQVLANVPVYSGQENALDLVIDEEVYVTIPRGHGAVSYTYFRAYQTVLDRVCRVLLDK